jgi:type II secretory pathway component PulJ
MDELFTALGRSAFRSRFRLSGKEAAYLKEEGLAAVLEHARDFVTKRLAQANPANDGRQTPMRNHPAFVAQHASGTCCRKCLAKWHGIPRGKPLTTQQIDYILQVLKRWLTNQNAHEPTLR